MITFGYKLISQCCRLQLVLSLHRVIVISNFNAQQSALRTRAPGRNLISVSAVLRTVTY